MELDDSFKYFAFISYSHEDKQKAEQIQKKLSEYKLPIILHKEHPELPENVCPIFRDDTHLTTGFLSEEIREALEQSKFLIALCSPNSAKPNKENKHWVNEEVKYYKKIGRTRYIIPVIIDGEPHSANSDNECFCPELLNFPGGDELLGIDMRPNKKKKNTLVKLIKRKLGIPDEDDLEEKGIVHIFAKMIGMKKDDLWEHNKKQQKREAYKKIFNAAAFFISILIIGLTVYFMNFHVFHKYYVDYVEKTIQKKNGTDVEFIGLGKLSKKEIKNRYRHYKFDYRGGKLRKIVYENSVGVPKEIESIIHPDRPKIQELEYNPKTKCLQAINSLNEYGSILVKFCYEQKGNVIDIKGNDGVPIGLPARTTPANYYEQDVVGNVKSVNIKSFKYERNEDGYITKKMYFKTNGAEFYSKDLDGVSGFEFILDELGRPIQVWYLGIEGDSFERQESKDGIAGYFLNYDEDYNICKTVFVNSDGTPFFNKHVNSGTCIIKYEYENGNLIKEINCDESENVFNNLNGQAYVKKEYDEKGNIISCSSYDENDFYLEMEKYVYDKKGNVIETAFYNQNKKNYLTKEKYAIIKNKYNTKNLLIEENYFDENGAPSLCKELYAKKVLAYNKTGDLVKIQFFDENDISCSNSDGYSVINYTYTENHKRKEQKFYIDNLKSQNNPNGFFNITYKFD
jgi:hypothetical protein